MRHPAFHITQGDVARRIVYKYGSRIAVVLFEDGLKSTAFHTICCDDPFIQEVIIDKLEYLQLFGREGRSKVGGCHLLFWAEGQRLLPAEWLHYWE